MKDQRDQIVKAVAAHHALLTKVDELETRFAKIGCRYREGGWCQHPRFMMKKYPQHQPRPANCDPGICPRN